MFNNNSTSVSKLRYIIRQVWNCMICKSVDEYHSHIITNVLTNKIKLENIRRRDKQILRKRCLSKPYHYLN